MSARWSLLPVLSLLAFALLAGVPAHASTILCGVITGTLSPSGNPWIVTCNSYVNAADLVILEPGVVMQIESGVDFEINGTLEAIGTGAQPILLGSAETVPGSGFYGTVRVSGKASFAHTTLSQGTGWSITGEFNFDQGEINDHSDADGLAAVVFATGSYGTISDTTFDNPGRPIAMAEDTFVTFSDLQFSANHFARSIFVTGGTWTINRTWTNAGPPYEFGGDFYVTPGNNQKFQAGVVVKVGSWYRIWFEDVTTFGTLAEPVVFTSIVDDTHGGDTYGDGPGSPGPGDYDQIDILGTGNLSSAWFLHGHGLFVRGHAEFTNARFESQLGADSYTGALYFAAGSSGAVHGGYFHQTVQPIMLGADSDVELTDIEITSSHDILAILIVDGLWHQSRHWENFGVPYEFGGGSGHISFEPSTNQIVDAGVVFKIWWNTIVTFDGLQVNGTEEAPVIFTAKTDDEFGGDTYGNGPEPTTAGDYGLIEIHGTTAVEHARFRYGSGIQVTAHADFDHVTVERQYAVTCPIPAIEFRDGTTGSVTNSHFADSCLPIELWVNANPHLSGLTAESQAYANAVMVGGGPWSVERVWTDPGIPYYFRGILSSSFDVVHKFKAGTVFKFEVGNSFTGVEIDNDSLQGTADRPVVFTSFADDSVGGDSNVDGPSTGTSGDWGKLLLYDNDSYNLSHIEVRYAQTGLRVQFGSFIPGSIRHCVFRHNQIGLDLGSVYDPLYITDNQFISNDIGVTLQGPANLVLGDLSDGDPNNDGRNQFVCNGFHAENSGTGEIKAENNWWGHAPPVPALFTGFGSFDLDPYWLGPGPVPLTELLLERAGPSDVALMWDDVAPTCGYRVLRSTGPMGGFVDLSGPITPSDFTDVGAVIAPDTYYYLVTIE